MVNTCGIAQSRRGVGITEFVDYIKVHPPLDFMKRAKHSDLTVWRAVATEKRYPLRNLEASEERRDSPLVRSGFLDQVFQSSDYFP